MTLGLNAVCEELPDFLVAGDDDDPPRAVHVTVPPGRNRIPGEPGLWIFILGDMTLFGAFFIALMWENRQFQTVFQSSAAHLNRPIGAVNTLVLLLSSYAVVAAISAHRRDKHRLARRWLNVALACGVVFVALKAVEYTQGIAAGHTPTSNMFFTFYYVLTGIHLLHVLLGTGLLAIWGMSLRRQKLFTASRQLAEGIAVYWHMVDLLWVLIFSLVYLVCAA
jgi:nitric oxide reductase NorE protein